MTVSTRPTQRELNDRKRADAREATRAAIAEGRVIVRQMTKAERKDADVRMAAHAAAKAERARR